MAYAVSRYSLRRGAHAVLMLPFAFLLALAVAAGTFIAYVLWPDWPNAAGALEAPTLPITVAGVLFDVPSSAIRIPVERQAGLQERLDLAFLWPSPAPPAGNGSDAAASGAQDATSAAVAAADANRPLFVTIAELGAVLPPAERLNTIYPHYVEAQATAGPRGLAILPFRAGSPYDGEDLVYLPSDPAQFFARCTRQDGVMPGMCIQERAIDAAEITLRFPRTWLTDWRNTSTGFDRLVAELHPH